MNRYTLTLRHTVGPDGDRERLRLGVTAIVYEWRPELTDGKAELGRVAYAEAVRADALRGMSAAGFRAACEDITGEITATAYGEARRFIDALEACDGDLRAASALMGPRPEGPVS